MTVDLTVASPEDVNYAPDGKTNSNLSQESELSKCNGFRKSGPQRALRRATLEWPARQGGNAQLGGQR